MCIILSTIKHSDYPFILLSNRDEFFRRPTQEAHFRELKGCTKILSPLDLGRSEHGTWIGVTTKGKIAVLVNYHENDYKQAISKISRGILPLEYLNSDLLDDDWYKSLEFNLEKNCSQKAKLSKIGGFTLVYGQLKVNTITHKIGNLSIMSNRGYRGEIFATDISDNPQLMQIISRKSTFGLSNSLFYEPWKKVEIGESLLDELINKSIDENLSKEKLVEEFFKILSHDTFSKDIAKQGDFNAKLSELKNSIFIPPLLTDIIPTSTNKKVGKFYGTRTQTVIILDKFGNLSYYEKNLHDSDELNSNISIEKNLFEFHINNE